MRIINVRFQCLVLIVALTASECNADHSARAIAVDGNPATQSPAALTTPAYFSTPVKGQCCLVIAHAGGAIDGNTYTNSREAVEENYALGTRIFELDFQQTSDGHWVVTHDWESWKSTTEYTGAVPPDLATFSGRKLIFRESGWSIGAQYSPISLQWVNEFLRDHKDAAIVTDAKELAALPALVAAILSFPTRTQFIFQAYSISDVDAIKKQDASARIILTLYRMGRPQPPLYEAIAKHRNELEGVTLPMNWAYDPATLDALKATGLPLYLHGSPVNINSRSLHAYFASKGVSGFYLD